MDPRTADTKYLVNPNDFTGDPAYGYHSLDWHAARIEADERRAARGAAKTEREAARRRAAEKVAA